MAEKRPPLQVGLAQSFDSLMYQEGILIGSGFNFNGIIPTSETQIGTLAPSSLTLGHAFISEGQALLSSNADLLVQVRTSSGAATTIIFSQIWLPKDKPTIVPIPKLLKSGEVINISVLNGDNTNTVRLTGHCSGFRVANDFNILAQNIIYWLGDSITENAQIRPEIRERDLFEFKVRDGLIQASTKDEQFRLVIKSSSGKTGVDFNTLLHGNKLFINEPKFIFWGFGVNDATATVPVGKDAYETAIQDFYDYKSIMWPNAELIFLGATPVQLNSRETALDVYRGYMQAKVTQIADPKVHFINLKDSFDRTVAGNYATTDAAGNGIHPATRAAHLGISNVILFGQNFNGTTTTGLLQLGLLS